MKQDGKAKKVPQRYQRVVSSRPRNRSQHPSHDTASMISPIPTMILKPKKGMTRRPILRRKGIKSDFARRRIAGGDEAAKPRNLDRKEVTLPCLVGNRDQDFTCRLLCFPARLDGHKLRRLLLEHIEAGQVAKKELDRNEQRDQAEPPVEHHARFHAMNIT